MIGVITWNIQWGRGADGLVNLSRTAADLRRLGDFDVICLQEVASRCPGLAGGREEDGVAFFAEAFPEYTLVSAFGVDRAHPAGGRSRFGNLLLSRLPVGDVVRHRLPWPPDPDKPSMVRTALEVVVVLPGGRPVRVLTTHLEYYSGRQRTAQVDDLRRYQEEALAWSRIPLHPKEQCGPFARPMWPTAAVVCGDFNFQPESAHWRQLTASAGGETLWKDAWSVIEPTRPHPHSVGLHGAEWPDHPYCCDFFFVSAPLTPAVRTVRYDPTSSASDHQPVMLEIDEAAVPAAP